MSAEKYFAEIKKMIASCESTQMDNIKAAADLVTDATLRGRLTFAAGAGHSHLLALELFTRAGGLGSMQAVVDAGLVFISGSRRQGGFERLTGYAKIVIQDYDIQPKDVVIVISNSGRNPEPVEFAIEAKAKGATVIALTSMKHSRSVSPNNPAGKMLYQVADLVLDNQVPAGDACVEIKGLPPMAAPASTVMGALILNAIVAQVAQNIMDAGQLPPVGFSGNLEGAREYNEKVASPLRDKFRSMMRNV